MYAYSVRGVGNPELHTAFESKICETSVESLDYPSLFNMVYFLLFRESTNEKAWSRVVEATIAQKDVLPLRYYKPFKCSKLWLR